MSKSSASKDRVFDMDLPLPVSCNAMYTIGGYGVQKRVILSQQCRTYYTEMDALLAREWPGQEVITGRLKAEVWLYENDLRRRDINNYTKTLFDALERAKVFEDDSQIDETVIHRGEMRDPPGVRLKLTVIAETDERIPMRELEKKRQQADAEHARKKQARSVLARAAGKGFADDLKLFSIPEPTKRPRPRHFIEKKDNKESKE